MEKDKTLKKKVPLTERKTEPIIPVEQPDAGFAYAQQLAELLNGPTEAEANERERLEELAHDFEEESFQTSMLRFQVSGLYANRPKKLPLPFRPFPLRPIPVNLPIGPQPIPFLPPLRLYREDVRLDVDGRYPQMMASGTITSVLHQVHWIAKLQTVGNKYIGNIWYTRDPSHNFKYQTVEITPIKSFYRSQRKVRLTFKGGNLQRRTIVLSFQTDYFRKVEFEYDCEKGVSPITLINTHAHPNRPPALPSESLSIRKVFERAGFKVSMTGANNSIPNQATGANATWSNNEMHDAMQTYWSRFANVPQWSLWVLFAKQHDMGNGLGGIMFDSIGPNHRQGTALFYNSFISKAPNNDPQPAAWINRMRFWTAVHEMGHAFNLAHSWQKELGNPWIAGLHNEPEARSFMNYPFRVNGGQQAFFSDFDFRFSNQELIFMRHAPEDFVQMGNADWFDHHGFQWANVSAEPKLQLELRVHRPKNEFEFLEPVLLELKLKNVSEFPQVIDKNTLNNKSRMTLIVKREDQPAMLHYPFATFCQAPDFDVLKSGEAMYSSHFISAGKKGWMISEPGYYTIQLSLRLPDGEDVVSNALRIRVAPARSYDEQYLAQDYFSDDIARIYAFKGSRVLQTATDTLHEVSERLTDRRVALHAQSMLARPLLKPYKELDLREVQQNELQSAEQLGAVIKLRQPQFDEAEKLLNNALNLSDTGKEEALQEQLNYGVETLGHIEATKQAYLYKDVLKQRDQLNKAQEVLRNLKTVLEKRGVIREVTDKLKRDAKKLEG